MPARKKPGSRARLFPWGGSCTPRLSVLHTGRDTYCRQAEQSYVLWHIERDRSPAGAPRGAGGCCAGHGKSRAMGEPGFSRAVCRSPTLSVWEARECVEGDRLTARPPSRGDGRPLSAGVDWRARTAVQTWGSRRWGEAGRHSSVTTHGRAGARAVSGRREGSNRARTSSESGSAIGCSSSSDP